MIEAHGVPRWRPIPSRRASPRSSNACRWASSYRGRKIGEQTRFDNRLLIAFLSRYPAPPDPTPAGEDPLDFYRRALDALHDPPPLETKDFLGDSAWLA